MANWRNRNWTQEAEKARLFNQQVMQLSGHLHDRDYTEQAGMTNLSALIAQEEGRSFGSGRVIARDQNRAATAPVVVIERNSVLCWSCGNPLRESEIVPERITSCQKCTKEHEVAEQEREASYAQSRQDRVERALEEHEAWRLAQYEKRLQEQAELEAHKGERYGIGTLNQECESIQGSFGMDHLYNPILREFFELGNHALVPVAGDLIIESGYKKEQISGSGWTYWLLAGDSIVVVEVWEEGLFPSVIEKVEVL